MLSVLSTTLLLLLCSALPGPAECSTSEQRESVMQDLLQRGHNMVRPDGEGGGGSPVLVDVDLSISHVMEVDVNRRYMQSLCYLMMAWDDPRLTFSHPNVSDIRIDVSNIWIPDIEFYDTTSRVKSLTHKDIAFVDQNGHVIWVPKIILNTFCAQSHGSSINCTFTMGSWTYNGLKLDLRHVRFGSEESSGTDPSGQWTITSTSSKRKVKTYPCCPEPYVSVVFSVILQRTGRGRGS